MVYRGRKRQRGGFFRGKKRQRGGVNKKKYNRQRGGFLPLLAPLLGMLGGGKNQKGGFINWRNKKMKG